MRGKFEIEDLSSERWSKIERDVFERLDREEVPRSSAQLRASRGPRRAIATFVLAGAAAAVIGAVAWEKLRPATHGEQTNVSRVSTDDSASHVQVGENEVDVGAHSSVAIRGNDTAGIEIALDHGEIECEVAPRQGRPPFVVVAGDVRVRVIGTHFHVVRLEKTSVSVQRGTVEVDQAQSVTLVHAGEAWPAPVPAQPTAEVPSAFATAPSLAVTPQSTAHPTATGLATNLLAPSEPTRRERYERALGLESSQPDVALATYRELAGGADAWAMNALFAQARLEYERGHKDDARRLSTEYLARFPGGPNARDARELKSRLE